MCILWLVKKSIKRVCTCVLWPIKINERVCIFVFRTDTISIQVVCICVIESAYVFSSFGEFDAFCAYVLWPIKS